MKKPASLALRGFLDLCIDSLARLSSLPLRLLLSSSQDLSRGSCRTNPRTPFRDAYAGRPYPFASSLFCEIHRSAASISDSCAAVIPGMRPPPPSGWTRASSADAAVLTQVSPRRALDVNFWDFSSVMSTPESAEFSFRGPKHSASNDIAPELSREPPTPATADHGESD